MLISLRRFRPGGCHYLSKFLMTNFSAESKESVSGWREVSTGLMMLGMTKKILRTRTEDLIA